MCWDISHLHLRNFSIVCIVLSSAHIKCFIYFSLSVRQNRKNRSSTLGPGHLNPVDILRNYLFLPQEFLQGFF